MLYLRNLPRQLDELAEKLERQHERLEQLRQDCDTLENAGKEAQAAYVEKLLKLEAHLEGVAEKAQVLNLSEQLQLLARQLDDSAHWHLEQGALVREQLAREIAGALAEQTLIKTELGELRQWCGNQTQGVRDQLVQDRTSFKAELKATGDRLEEAAKAAVNNSQGVRDQLMKDRTAFREELKALAERLEITRKETLNQAQGVRDQLIQDRTVFREELNALAERLEITRKDTINQAQGVRDQLIQDRTVFREELSALAERLEITRKDTINQAQGVRDQFIQDRTTFREELKVLAERTAEGRRTALAQSQSVRDQFLQDRTTFRDELKALQERIEDTRRTSQHQSQGVRDQLVQDRAHHQQFQTRVENLVSSISSSHFVQRLEKLEREMNDLEHFKSSWLHPEYYYRNVVSFDEDRHRLLHKAIALLPECSQVLDIGPGNCFAMQAFLANGHQATGIGLALESYIPNEVRTRYALIEGDYNEYQFDRQFDALWASHVLEHQPDKQRFIAKMFQDLKEGGWLFVLVPPMKPSVVGGHLNLFNLGYLVYSLVVGGFDCSEAMVTKYGYNLVVFVRKKAFDMPALRYDSGDIELLAPFFPFEATQDFNGLHVEANWKW